jgi:flagellar biosynthesis anti-sigma factor FlgM
MKINSVGNNDAISKYSTGVGRSAEKAAPMLSISDKLELSEEAQKFADMLKAVKVEMDKLGERDEAKTADIIERIKNGTYQVDSNDIAASILKGYAGQ